MLLCGPSCCLQVTVEPPCGQSCRDAAAGAWPCPGMAVCWGPPRAWPWPALRCGVCVEPTLAGVDAGGRGHASNARSEPPSSAAGERGLAGTGRARPAGVPLADCGSAWAAGASWQEPRGPECFQDAGTSWCLSKLVGAVKFLYANNGLCMLNVLKNIWTVSKKMV